MIILKCDSVSKNFGKLKVLKQLSFELKEKEFLSLLGPSGCGKSTLLRIIAGLETLDTGEVTISNDVVSNPHTMLAPEKRHIGLVFQDVALFPHLSVGKNIAFGLKGGEKRNQKRIEELLELIDLRGYQNKLPHEISGGEQQRVSLARALAPSPDLILLDEPFSSLDFQLRTQVRRDLHRVLKDSGVSVILVTHDQTEAFAFSERVLVFYEGKIVQEGEPSYIYRNPVSPWVAAFVGESNFITRDDLQPLLENGEDLSHLSPQEKVLIRPEDFTIMPVSVEEHGNATVDEVEFGGDHLDLAIRLSHSGTTLHVTVDPKGSWKLGQPIKLMAQSYNSW